MQWFHRLNVLFFVSVTTIYFVTLLCPGSALPKKKWIDQIAMESEVPAAEDSKSKPGVGLSAEEMMQVSVLPSSPGASYGGYKINPNCRCGISNSEDGNQHPWTAAIFYKYRESPDPDAKSTMILFCTGTLINDRWVLTASRCVQGLNATDLQVWLSEKPVWSDQSTKEDQTLKKTIVDNIIIHPDFDPSTLNHEIALLRLADPVRLSAPPTPPILSEEVDVSENLDDVDRKPKKNEEESQSQGETASQPQFFTPVCLPKYDVIDDSMQKMVIQKKENEKERETEQNDDANENDNENAYIPSMKGTVVSWEKKGRTSYSLVENKVPFVNGIAKCLEMIQRHSNSSVNLNDNMLCAGDMEHDVKDSCAMDTGSPLVILENGSNSAVKSPQAKDEDTRGHYTLLGISSWLYGCTNLENVSLLYDVIFPNNTAKPQVPGVYTRVERKTTRELHCPAKKHSCKNTVKCNCQNCSRNDFLISGLDNPQHFGWCLVCLI